MFRRVLEALRQPGAKRAVQGSAPTQHVPHENAMYDEENNDKIIGFSEVAKPRTLDRWLDQVVCASGSEPVFYSILAGLAAWALLGIQYGKSETWQVIISDVQAILSYAFDSLLVRQQMNMYDRELLVATQLQSRIRSHKRMLAEVHDTVSAEDRHALVGLCTQDQQDAAVQVEDEKNETLLPTEGKFGKFITAISHVLGHIITVGLFWVGVFVWIGIGPLCDWSDTWQLYMNSASSALMVLYFAFLANIRERHSAHNKKCLETLFVTDATLELRLRMLTGDVEHNEEVIIPAPKVGRIQRAIFYYADFVGTLVGIAILVTVMIAWVATGPVFQFSANWWLFIGTYAGLVGMNDGFVLRNMQSRLTSYVDNAMSRLEQEDELIFQSLGLPLPVNEERHKLSVTEYVSLLVDKVSAHELTVAAGFLTILGLLAGASAMQWSLTGQLLCNVPPSLIESFFMMILVTGHNLTDDRKRAEMQVLYERRLRLLKYVDLVKKSHTNLNKTPISVDPAVLEGKKLAVDATFLQTVSR